MPEDKQSADDGRSSLTLKRLGKDTLLYSIGTAVAKVASLIMLPVYTHVFTPHDYGLLQLLDMTVELASVLVTAGVGVAVFRSYFVEERPSRRMHVVVSGWFLLVLLQLSGALILLAVSPLIWHLVLKDAGTIGLVQLAAASFAASSLPVIPILLLRIEQRAGAVVIVSIAKLVIQLSLNIYFLLGLRWGVASVLASTLIANVSIGIPASLWLLTRTGVRPDRAVWRELVRFGVPFQIGQLAMFVLAFGDRYFLQAARGLSSVGIYSLAYQFGFFLSTLGAESFLQAWSPQMFRFISHSRESREPRYNEGLWILSFVMTTLCVGIALFSRPALRILAGPAYQGAADLVPLICLCYVVQAWTALMHFGIDVSGQTRYSSYANWTAAGVIIALYAVLIPAFGGWGAAFATLLGFLVRFALTAHWSHQLWPISYEWRPSLMMAGLAILAMAFGTLLRSLGLYSLIIGSGVLSLIFLAAVWTFVAGPEMRQRARAFLARTFWVARTALTRA